MPSVGQTWIVMICLFEVLTTSASAAELNSNPNRILEYTIYEEQPAGMVIGDIRQDSNITRRYREEEALLLRFSFRQSTTAATSRLFSIDEIQGVIRTTQVIDRDVLCPFSLTCDLVLDVAVKPLQYFQILKVVVHLIDINDNTPTFPEARIEISIVETATPGALFPLPAAEDADSGLLAVQDYQLMTDFDCFELRVSDQVDGSKDVRLRLTKALDREVLDYYYVTVLALDGGRPPRSGSVFVDIVVRDANDNVPRFDNHSYEVSVREDLPSQSVLLRVRATDPDEGPNGVVVYGFSDQTDSAHRDTFGINNRTGAIYLIGQLDYEQVQTIQLTVRARDQGPNSLPVFAKVTIHVLDVNDNPPQISVNVLTMSGLAEVQENSDRGSFVAHIAVKDADLGSSGEVDCVIDNRDLFRLEPLFPSEYKIVTVVTFDREVRSSYTVGVTCKDTGQPPLSSSETIDVVVTDENDHDPNISLPLYEVYLAENTPPKSATVAKIEATDEDSGKNRALQYRIRSLDATTEGVLSIDLITGRVAANVAFDYEDRHKYGFLVTVSDQGDEPRSSTTTLILNIVDANDERPAFDRSNYHFSTRENLSIGTVIGRVVATDRDLTPEFRDIVYRLRFPSDFFEVDRLSGEIFNTRRLDREDVPVHRLIVVASNRGQPQETDIEGRVNVTVVVEDENDNAPVFVFPSALSKTAQVAGSTAIRGSLITRLVATDADSDANSRIRYEISHGNENDQFDLDPSTGVLTVGRTPLSEGESSANKVFNLVVVAKDGGFPPIATIADLIVFVNNSVQPNYAAHEGNGGHQLEGSSVAIIVGALLGSLLVLACIIVSSVFVYRHRRTAKQKISSPVVCEQLRPLSRAKNSCRSLNTVDSGSIISADSHGPTTCRQYREGNAGGSMVLAMNADGDDDDVYVDRIPADWPLRPSLSLRMPKVRRRPNSFCKFHRKHLFDVYYSRFKFKKCCL